MLARALKREWITPLSLGVFGIALAFSISIARGIEQTGIQDAKDYVAQARDMAHGWRFMVSNSGSFQHPLGLPFLVLLPFLLFKTSSLLMIKVLLSLGHGLSTFLVAKIGKRMELRQSLWVLGAIAFALDPFMFFPATDVQTESLTTLIILFWAYLYTSPEYGSKFKTFAIISFPFTGFIAVFIRPHFLLLFLFVAVILYSRWLHFNIKPLLLAASATIFLVLFSLYEVILSILYKGFIFLSPIGGWNAILTCRTEFVPST